ncbi:MAG: DUF2304 domain-containing protein [Streptococcaceae bacterium]|jgi:hypothetical protein|nr:DUF2304 domain-containing protein [Streptococcaceae bacterium]
MPLQLRIIAIIFAISFFGLTINLVRKDRAEVRHMRKWLLLAVIMIFGALLPSFGSRIAQSLGILNFTSLALFILTGVLLVFSLRYQIFLIDLEKENKVIIQELSLLKQKVREMEQEKTNQ